MNDKKTKITQKNSPKEKDVFLSEDAVEDFKKRMNKFPLLPESENERLALLSQQGDKIALEKLINHNLRLAFKEASKYFLVAKHLKKMDLIQEACIGLFEAAKAFDPTRGAFSTCAALYIKKNLKFALLNSDDEIRKPVNLKGNEFAYKKLISNYLKNNIPIPSDEELCEILKVSKDALNYFKNADKLTPTSMNKKVDEDDDATELGDFISGEKDSYNDVVKEIDNEILAIILKSVLKPLEYFVIYNRFFDNKYKRFEDIGDTLKVSRQRIKQIEEKALEKITPYMEKNKIVYKRTLNRLIKTQPIEMYNKEPIEPSKIVLFLYIKDSLTDIEKTVLYYQLFGKYKIDYYLKKLVLKKSEYEKINDSIIKKSRVIYDDFENFENFNNTILNQYQTTIYKINLQDENIIDFEKIKDRYFDLSYERILHLFDKENIALNEEEKLFLQKYFYIPSNQKTSKSYVEKEIYLVSFGYKMRSNELNPKVLYNTFLENIDEFDEEQRLYLECLYFKIKNKKDFTLMYPDSKIFKHKAFLIRRLEKMYYHINDYFVNNFNKEKYLFVKNKYRNELSDKRIQELDMYYGVNGKIFTIGEIAEFCNEDYIKVHDRLRTSRDYCMSLYYNKTNHLTTDMNIYIPYLLDGNIEFTDDVFNILKAFIIDKKDYNQIRMETNLSKARISNTITDGIRKMDFYRFGIQKRVVITKDELEEFLKEKNKLFTEEEKTIIYLRKIEKAKTTELASKFNLPKEKINKIIDKFNKSYLKFKVNSIELTDDDFINEINAHISESVIKESHKEILSYYYGLVTKYNSNGIKLSLQKLLDKFNITEDSFWHIIQSNKVLIKSKKAGIETRDLLYISRNELDDLLNDYHLPISDKERDIICFLFELKGYPYKNLKELAIIYNEQENSIRRRYQRAILNIYKYLNNEIGPQLNYEVDIEPNLKYFSKCDELLIIEYFKNKLTTKQISDKYKISLDRVIEYIKRIYNYILELLNDPSVSKFDFEFYRNHKNDSNLQYFGDIDKMIQIFDMYFGESNIKRLSSLEIIKKLKLDISQSNFNLAISNFMLCFCKLKDGIIKIKTPDEAEIVEFYKKKKDELTNIQITNFHKYFMSLDKKSINKNYTYVTSNIIFYILKDKYPNYFDLNTVTRGEVINILKENLNYIDDAVKYYLFEKFEISEREFMSDKEIYQVYKILNKLEIAKNKKTEELALSRKLEK